MPFFSRQNLAWLSSKLVAKSNHCSCTGFSAALKLQRKPSSTPKEVNMTPYLIQAFSTYDPDTRR